MASPQAAAIDRLFDSFITAMTADPGMSLDTLRDLFGQCGDLAAEPGGVDYLEADADGIPCLWAVPKGCREDRVLLSAHGGGCVTGDRFTHRKLFAHIAKQVGCRALIVDYGRAPEQQHPTQVSDCLKAYEWLLGQGIKPAHIATVGDSAGGNLCTAVVLAARDKKLPLPAALMPMSPWYDMEGLGASMTTNAKVDRLVTPAVSGSMVQMYIGKTSPKDPLVNPLYADCKGLPPIYIQVGGYEALLDDSLRFTERAKAAGVDCHCDVYPEMQHVFQFMAGRAPEADDAIAKLAAWVKPHLGLA